MNIFLYKNIDSSIAVMTSVPILRIYFISTKNVFILYFSKL